MTVANHQASSRSIHVPLYRGTAIAWHGRPLCESTCSTNELFQHALGLLLATSPHGAPRHYELLAAAASTISRYLAVASTISIWAVPAVSMAAPGGSVTWKEPWREPSRDEPRDEPPSDKWAPVGCSASAATGGRGRSVESAPRELPAGCERSVSGVLRTAKTISPTASRSSCTHLRVRGWRGSGVRRGRVSDGAWGSLNEDKCRQ